MPGCDHCDEDFSSKQEKLEHELEEHSDDISSHARSEKKTTLNKIKQKNKVSSKKRKQTIQYSAYAVILLLVVGGGVYWLSQSASFNAGPSGMIGNGSAMVGQAVHWHANYQINVCGEDRVLENGPLQAHTHGEKTFHLEGTRTTEEQATLDWVVDQLGGEFSNDGILGYNEPESCPGSDEPGNLTVEINSEPIDNPADYIVQDGDYVQITYE